MNKRIGYQGIQGSFSYLTALRCFGKEALLRGHPTFRDVFESVQNNEVDVGLLPIENSLAGSICENYDLLLEYCDMSMIAETYTPIEHSLLVVPSCQEMSEITHVFSHPKALEQCTRLFQEHPHIEKVVCYDTAASAKMIAEAKDPSHAAIAHPCNAELYGLKELMGHVEDHPQNTTRFIVISKQKGRETSGKCTLTFTLEHSPGALAAALLGFSDVNLTKIESRPIKEKPFEYRFYVDLEIKDLEEIKHLTLTSRILGIYGNI